METNDCLLILNNKLALLDELLIIFKLQYDNLNSGDLDLLEQNINKSQDIMEQIDRLDVQINEYKNIEEIKENKEVILLNKKIRNVLINISNQDKINLSTSKIKCNEYSGLVKNVNVSKNIMAYEKVLQHDASYFIDTKE